MGKKEVKVSLGTAICIIIIVLLLCVIGGMWYYYNYIEKDNTKTEVISSSKKEDTVAEENKVTKTNTGEEDKTVNQKTQVDNSKNIIMYRYTNIANAKPQVYFWYFDSEKFPDYYNTTYDIYKNGKKIGTTKGTIKLYEDKDYEGGVQWYGIDYEEKEKYGDIYVSCNYNVIPRNYEDITTIPEKIKNDFIMSTNIQIQSIDLDGDGNKEYVVIHSNNENGERGVYLYDSNYKRISMIATQPDVMKDYPSHIANFENIEYIDIDNDEKMEIILLIPAAGGEGYRFAIYKYDGTSVTGPVDNYSIAP